MKILDRLILPRTALNTIILSAVECHYKEPRGFLFGHLNRYSFVCETAYHFGNADRKHSVVGYSNGNALDRLAEAVKLMRCADKRGYDFIGGYHGHPFSNGQNRRTLNQLSELDTSHDGMMSLDIEDFEQMDKGWVELIVIEERLNRLKPSRLAYNERNIEPNIDLILGGNKQAYRLNLSAFFMAPNHLFKKLLRKDGKLRKQHKETKELVQVFDVTDMRIELI